MLLTRAGIGAWSPQAQPLSGLFDCKEQPTREQEVGSKMEEPWWKFPQSFVKTIGMWKMLQEIWMSQRMINQ